MPRPRGGLREDFHDLVEQCFCDPHPHEGTRYPCKEEDLRQLQRLRHVHYPRRRSPDKACSDLVRHLTARPSSRVSAALRRIGISLELREWGPDLILKAFRDLDTAFFASTLSGRTTVKWKSDRELCAKGKVGVYGVTYSPRKGSGPQRIVLNAERIFKEGSVGHFKQMWGTMLHEMVHAYYAILCDNIGESHGPYFKEVMMSVNHRWRQCFGKKLMNREEKWLYGFD